VAFVTGRLRRHQKEWIGTGEGKVSEAAWKNVVVKCDPGRDQILSGSAPSSLKHSHRNQPPFIHIKLPDLHYRLTALTAKFRPWLNRVAVKAARAV